MSSAFGTFVVSGDTDQTAYCRTILGFRNLLDASSAVGGGVNSQDPLFPILNVTDFSYNTEYSVTVAPPASVETFFISSGRVNYFMIISKNAEECELSVEVSGYDPASSSEVPLCSFDTVFNGVSKMVYFGDDFDDGYIEVTYIKVVLTYTSKPYIMSMMCGEAIVFPRTPSLGFQPATTAYLDEVKQFYADEGLNLVGGRRLSRGKPLEGTINYVKMEFAESFWNEYANHVLDSKPVCLMWNDKKPDEVIYGAQDPSRLTKLKYKTNIFTSVDFYIVGWA